MRHIELFNEMLRYYSGDALRSQHFTKVYTFSELIGENERLPEDELEILTAAALVHDIGIRYAERLYCRSDGKLQEELRPPLAYEMLHKLGYDDSFIERVCFIVGHHHTYKGVDGTDWQILL